MSIKELLTRILNRIPKFTKVIDSNYQNTSANWECTGFSVTIPANHVGIIWAFQGYTSGAPIGIGFDWGTTLPSWQKCPTYCSYYSEMGIEYSPAFAVTAGTYYLYTKRNGAGSAANRYVIWVLDFNLGGGTVNPYFSRLLAILRGCSYEY